MGIYDNKNLTSEEKIRNITNRSPERRLEERDKRDIIIIEMLRKGYSITLISERLHIVSQTVRVSINRAISNGIITQEEIDEAKKRRDGKKGRKDEEDYEIFNELYIIIAQDILDLEVDYTNSFFEDFIKSLNQKIEKGTIDEDELNLLAKSIIIEKPDINNLGNAARLLVKAKRTDKAIRLLNQSKDFFEGEEFDRIQETIMIVRFEKEKARAIQMFKKGKNRKEVMDATGLKEVDIIPIERVANNQVGITK